MCDLLISSGIYSVESDTECELICHFCTEAHLHCRRTNLFTNQLNCNNLANSIKTHASEETIEGKCPVGEQDAIGRTVPTYTVYIASAPYT